MAFERIRGMAEYLSPQTILNTVNRCKDEVKEVKRKHTAFCDDVIEPHSVEILITAVALAVMGMMVKNFALLSIPLGYGMFIILAGSALVLLASLACRPGTVWHNLTAAAKRVDDQASTHINRLGAFVGGDTRPQRAEAEEGDTGDDGLDPSTKA